MSFKSFYFQSLSFGEAAALPLTAITAWEMLFDRLQARQRAGRRLSSPDRRRRWRRQHRDPARTPAHGPARDRNRLAT
jgi:hypothetical protein